MKEEKSKKNLNKIYANPSKEVLEAQQNSKKRILEQIKSQKKCQIVEDEKSRNEKLKHDVLFGQLKAAESRNRLRIMRLQYQKNIIGEIDHLVSCQPSALEAVRLQALLPSKVQRETHRDALTKSQRERVEMILENDSILKRNF